MPSIAVTVGTGRSSMALNRLFASTSQAMICSSGWLNMAVNSVISAPTMKAGLALEKITPEISASCSFATASLSSSRASRSNLFTEESLRSNTRWALPDGKTSTLSAWPAYIMSFSILIGPCRIGNIQRAQAGPHYTHPARL